MFPEKYIDRFWRKVSKLPHPKGCWEWSAGKTCTGYGVYYIEPKMRSAHRVSWLIVKGQIPSGLHVLHDCDNPCCVNPAHLFLGTHQDNMADRKAKGRGRSAIGAGNHNSKLSAEKVIRARLLYQAGGISFVQLGRLFKVRDDTIRSAIMRETWRHVL